MPAGIASPGHVSTAGSARSRVHLKLIVAVLLGVAIVRICWVVGQTPLVGYGNQFDMARVSSCIGWWPDVAHDPALPTPRAPQTHYRRGRTDPGGCQWSVDAMLAAAAFSLGAQAGERDERVTLHWVGALRASLLIVCLIAGALLLRRNRRLSVAHAVIAALLVADPFNMLWLNTLYGEFAAVAGAYLATMGVVALVLGRSREGILFLALGLFVLASSRMQHVLLPLVFLPVVALALRPMPDRRWALVACTAIAFAAGLLGFAIQSGSLRADLVNRSNTLFNAILPSVPDPIALTRSLGLDARCAELEYLSWYMPRGRDLAADCPGLASFARWRLPLALLQQPTSIMTLLGSSLYRGAAWRPGYLGEVAGPRHQRMPAGWHGLGASVADAAVALPFMAYAWLWLFVPVAGAVAATARLCRRGPVPQTGESAGEVLQILAGATASAICVIAVLGDGFSELSRHLHLAHNFVVLGLAVAAMRLVVAARRRAAWLQVLASMAITTALVWGIGRMPTAAGHLESPFVQRIEFEIPHRWVGWVADPHGILSAELVQGARRIRLPLVPAPDVAMHFPIDARHPAGRFDVEVEGLVPGEVRLVATNRRGFRTVVDRRCVVGMAGQVNGRCASPNEGNGRAGDG